MLFRWCLVYFIRIGATHLLWRWFTDRILQIENKNRENFVVLFQFHRIKVICDTFSLLIFAEISPWGMPKIENLSETITDGHSKVVLEKIGRRLNNQSHVAFSLQRSIIRHRIPIYLCFFLLLAWKLIIFLLILYIFLSAID